MKEKKQLNMYNRKFEQLERQNEELQTTIALLQRQLIQSENFLTAVFNSLDDPIFVKDEQHKWVFLNDAAAALWGLKKEDLIGKSDYDIFPKDEADIYWEKDNQVFASEATDLNEESQTINGKKHVIATKKSFFKDASSGKRYIVGSIRDISARKEIEERLQKSEREKEIILDSMVELVTLQDLSQKILYTNKAAAASVGKTADELIGKYCYTIWHNRTEPCESCPVLHALETGIPQKETNTTPDGRIWNIRGYPVRANNGSIVGAIEVTEQITDRIKKEEALRKSEQRYRFITENTTDIIFIQDLNLTITYISPSAELVSGYTIKELLTMDMHDLMTPESYKEGVKNFSLYLELAKKNKDSNIPLVEYEYIRKDGTTFWGELTTKFIRNEKGDIIGLQGVLRDVTTRKQAQDALKESEEKYRTLFENAGDAIVITNYEGEIVEVNKKACEYFGYVKKELFNQNPLLLQSPEYRSNVDEITTLLQQNKRAFFETGIMKKDRSVIPVEVTSVLCNYKKMPAVLSIVRDITERKKLERQLFQSQKMETIGRLAGGIAHDFNNLLTVILGYSDLIMARANLDKIIKDGIQEITRAGKRAALLTQRLLAFGRKQMLAPEIINLNELVENIENMLQRIIGEDIILRIELSNSLNMVKLDPTQIEQVILNLAVNSRDAMPQGGKLVITTANVAINDKDNKGHPEIRHGEYVLLTISDSGIGMDKETKRHIFEPFFTTKEVGKGTGLGLAMVYGIVKQSRGYIWVESEIEKGTVFTIYFPRWLKEKRMKQRQKGMVEKKNS